MVWIDDASEELKQLRARNLAILRECKLCIIAAKPQEAAVLVDELALTNRIDGNAVHQIAAGHQFYLGLFDGRQGQIPYFVTYGTRQGIQTFATQAATLFSLLQPQYALHVGVCAAIKDQGIKSVYGISLRDDREITNPTAGWRMSFLASKLSTMKKANGILRQIRRQLSPQICFPSDQKAHTWRLFLRKRARRCISMETSYPDVRFGWTQSIYLIV
jgi:hypothetical protein